MSEVDRTPLHTTTVAIQVSSCLIIFVFLEKLLYYYAICSSLHLDPTNHNSTIFDVNLETPLK
jgi:hypothetical protein